MYMYMLDTYIYIFAELNSDQKAGSIRCVKQQQFTKLKGEATGPQRAGS